MGLLLVDAMHKRDRVMLLVGAGAAAALAAATIAAPRDLMLYNPSRSVPQGLYVRMRMNTPVRVGAFVTVRARDVAPEEGRRRRFDDASDRFIKRVAAEAGAHVCGDGQSLVVRGENILVLTGDDKPQLGAVSGDDSAVGSRDDRSRSSVLVAVLPPNSGGRPAGWRGCRVLAANEVLLLGDTDDSFDGRYWGPLSVDLIEGVWRRF